MLEGKFARVHCCLRVVNRQGKCSEFSLPGKHSPRTFTRRQGGELTGKVAHSLGLTLQPTVVVRVGSSISRSPSMMPR
jgi:hypothetical protein